MSLRGWLECAGVGAKCRAAGDSWVFALGNHSDWLPSDTSANPKCLYLEDLREFVLQFRTWGD